MSRIEVARVGITDYEHYLKRTVKDALKEDHAALTSLEVKPYVPTTNEEADALAQTKGLLVVRGFLSLDGRNGRMLDFTMESGLTEDQDKQIAEQLAMQCVVCVKSMKDGFKHDSIRYSTSQQAIAIQ